MKIYVITNGVYSDYHICSVTTDKEKAKLLVDKYSCSYSKANIEIYDTDDEEIVLRYEHIYSCWYYDKNSEIRVNETEFDCFQMDDLKVRKFKEGLYVYVLANNENDALKFASDKFAKYRAEKMRL